VREGTLTSAEASDVLYDLVDEGMNLHPQVYAQIQRKPEEIGERLH
jgi:polyhydroxyalkanoate synthesis regulator phasin